MQTVKICSDREGQRIFAVEGQVTILGRRDDDFERVALGLESAHKKMRDSDPSMPEYIAPDYIVRFVHDGAMVDSFIYENDRVWIMNANGKTVASI